MLTKLHFGYVIFVKQYSITSCEIAITDRSRGGFFYLATGGSGTILASF